MFVLVKYLIVELGDLVLKLGRHRGILLYNLFERFYHLILLGLGRVEALDLLQKLALLSLPSDQILSVLQMFFRGLKRSLLEFLSF